MNFLVQKYKSEKIWVNYRLDERDGKVTKIPMDPHNGRMASSTNPSTWATYDDAKAT